MSAKSTRQRFFLVAIFALFSLPMLVAWVIYQGAGSRWTLPTGNHGVLIRPPRPVSVDGLRDIQGKPLGAQWVQRHWTLMYIAPAACEDDCLRSLDAIRRVRLALGEDMKRVRRVYVAAAAGGGEGPSASDPGLQLIRASALWLSNFVIRDRDGAPRGRIYVVDPQGLQMMYYPAGADPKGILKDLERLLKVSLAG